MGEFYAGVADIYYPNAVTPSQSVPLRLRWGEERSDINFELQDETTYWIRGTVVHGSTGKGCFDCVMKIARLDGHWVEALPKRVRVSPQGVFLARGLTAGLYRLSVRQAVDRRIVGQRVVRVSDKNVDDVVVISDFGQPVSGRIAFDEEAGGVTRLEFSVRLFALYGENWPIPEARVGSDLRFTLGTVPAETYRFEVLGLPSGSYLKALRLGGQKLRAPQLTVPEGASLSGVEAVIGFDGATLSGQVRARRSGGAGHETAEAWVALIPKPNQSAYAEERRVRTTGSGHFEFVGIPPAEYRLFALPVDSSAQVGDPNVQGTLSPYSRDVDLDPDATEAVDLPLAPDP